MGIREWLKAETKETNGRKEAHHLCKKTTVENILHSGRGSHFRLPSSASGLERRRRVSLRLHSANRFSGRVLARFWSRAWNLVRGQIGVVMRTAAEPADGPGRPFLASFGAEKGTVCPNRNP